MTREFIMTATRKGACLFIVVLAASVATIRAQGNGPSTAGHSVVPSAVQKRAMMPRPADTTYAQSIGKGALMVSTANSPTDSDSLWAERIDIDGDGHVDEANL